MATGSTWLLTDSAVLNLSKRIISAEELVELGVEVLNLPNFVIDAALYNKKEIQSAAHQILRTWLSAQTNRREAYTTLCAALRKYKKNELCALLKRWVEGNEEVSSCLTPERLERLQSLTKQSLRTKPFCLALGKEWTLRPSKTDLRQIHVDLSWIRKHRKASSVEKKALRSITEILNEDQLGEDGPVRILVQAGGGMGKSTTMKHLAISWADGTSEELKKFDFVFHISLKYVKDNSSIESIIIAQHSGLKANEVTPEEVRSILKGSDNSKVLLLIDGHDEYKTGRNTDIDEAIKKEKLWNCWIILTSRETEQIKNLKEYMDAELEIHGFNSCSVTKYVEMYLGSKGKEFELLQQTERAGLRTTFNDGILAVPIFLHMICVLFVCNLTLPETRTGILQAIVDRCMDREAIRARGQKAVEDAKKALYNLGKLAWQGLKEPVQRLIFTVEEVIRVAGTEALELGLLFGTENLTPQEEETDVLCFVHLMLQEFLAGKFISEQDEDSLHSLFPDISTVLGHRNVVKFACCLSEKPDRIVKVICDRLIDHAQFCLDNDVILESQNRDIRLHCCTLLNEIVDDTPAFSSREPFYSGPVPSSSAELLAESPPYVVFIEHDLSSKNLMVLTGRFNLNGKHHVDHHNYHIITNVNAEKAADITMSPFETLDLGLTELCRAEQALSEIPRRGDLTELRYLSLSPNSLTDRMVRWLLNVRKHSQVFLVQMDGLSLRLTNENSTHREESSDFSLICELYAWRTKLLTKQITQVLQFLGKLKKFGCKIVPQTVNLRAMRILCSAEDEEQLTLDPLELSKTCNSLLIDFCAFPSTVWKNIASQIQNAENLQNLSLQRPMAMEENYKLNDFSRELRDTLVSCTFLCRHLVSLFLNDVTMTGCSKIFPGCISDAGYPSLECLSLVRARLSASDAKCLLNAIANTRFPKLKRLMLSENTLTDCIPTLLDGSKLPPLETLDLGLTELCKSDIQALSELARRGDLSELRSLCLSPNTLTDMIADLFSASDHPGFSSLENLDLTEIYLSPADNSALTNAIQAGKLPTLKCLSISGDDREVVNREMRDLRDACRTQYRHRHFKLELPSLNEHNKFQTISGCQYC